MRSWMRLGAASLSIALAACDSVGPTRVMEPDQPVSRAATVEALPTHEIRVSEQRGKPSKLEVVRTRSVRGAVAASDDSRLGARLATAPVWFTVPSKLRSDTHSPAVFRFYRMPSETLRETQSKSSIESSAMLPQVSQLDDEYPIGWDPEVAPYPPAVLEQLVDAAISEWTADYNDETAGVQDDDAWEFVPGGVGQRTSVGENWIGNSLKSLLSTEPCKDERDDMHAAHIWYNAGVVAATMIAVAMIINPPAAFTAVAAIAGEGAGLGALKRSLYEKRRDFTQCVANNQSYYRRP